MKKSRKFSESDAVRNYLFFMHELVTRNDLVLHAVKGRLNLSLPYAREYCYLQFRRICELVALGCLQLHGDIPCVGTSDAKKEWNAGKIMGLLHKHHSHSFPQSITKTKKDGVWHLQGNSNPEAITLKEFKSLYNSCGEVLHRGTIKSIDAEGPLKHEDYELVIQWQRKLIGLLNQHIIVRGSQVGMYLISLKSENGLPACSVFSNFKGDTVQVENYNLKLSNGDSLEMEKRSNDQEEV